jgi:hypothetical protein
MSKPSSTRDGHYWLVDAIVTFLLNSGLRAEAGNSELETRVDSTAGRVDGDVGKRQRHRRVPLNASPTAAATRNCRP